MIPPASSPHVRVSVVIPAYGVAAYIREALESVLPQAGENVEVIVVNDGSPDTEELEAQIAEFRDRIIYIKQENGGVSSARNTGILAARGEWLAFLDADDAWLPGYLDGQLAAIEADPRIDMIFPDAILFGDTALAGRRTMEFSPVPGEITFLKALAGECTIGYCCLVRRDLVLKAGLFDTDLRGSEDYNLWLRILKLGGRIVCQEKPLYRYRRRAGSATSNPVWMNERILESFAKSESTLGLSPEQSAALGRHRRKIQIELATARAKAALEKRDWAAASTAYREVNRLRPSLKSKGIVLLLSTFPALTYKLLQWREKKASP